VANKAPNYNGYFWSYVEQILPKQFFIICSGWGWLL